jgi:hypothetical protein
MTRIRMTRIRMTRIGEGEGQHLRRSLFTLDVISLATMLITTLT